MEIEHFGVEDIMLIQRKEYKKDPGIYQQSVKRRLDGGSNKFKRVH